MQLDQGESTLPINDWDSATQQISHFKLKLCQYASVVLPEPWP